MTISTGTGSEEPSSFLTTTTMACPPDILALAASSTPKSFAFVRGIGPATLQTAWDAAKAGIVLPILVGEPEIIANDAAAIGWDLSGVEIIPATTMQDAADKVVNAAIN